MGNADTNSRIALNIHELQTAIAKAAERAGRDAKDIRLVAVSKTVGDQQIQAAITAGLKEFGENRSKQFAERQASFNDVAWHFIGRIQTNKIKDFVGTAALVHSVASERVLRAIAKRAEQLGLIQSLLIEVNTAHEASKDGVSPHELPSLLEVAQDLPTVRVQGLMTVAPIASELEVQRCFADLRELSEQMQQSYAGVTNLALAELSMGMSDDFLLAIREGATILRIGRSIWR